MTRLDIAKVMEFPEGATVTVSERELVAMISWACEFTARQAAGAWQVGDVGDVIDEIEVSGPDLMRALLLDRSAHGRPMNDDERQQYEAALIAIGFRIKAAG